MNELDAAQSKAKKSEDLEHDLKQQLQGMQESVKERDRNLAAMRDQIKYYVAFAEHSISNPKTPVAENSAENENQESSSLEHLNNLVKELQDAKDEIQSLSSTNVELKRQLDSMSNDAAGDSSSASSSSMLEKSALPTPTMMIDRGSSEPYTI